MRRVGRARAYFQNQKSETPAGTLTSGSVDEEANPVWGWVESKAKFASSHEKAMASFRACFCCQVVCLLVEVLVCLRAKDIPSAHCPPAPRRRSSNS